MATRETDTERFYRILMETTEEDRRRIADVTGISFRRVNDYIKRRKVLHSPGKLIQLAQALCVPIGHLLGCVEDPLPQLGQEAIFIFSDNTCGIWTFQGMRDQWVILVKAKADLGLSDTQYVLRSAIVHITPLDKSDMHIIVDDRPGARSITALCSGNITREAALPLNRGYLHARERKLDYTIDLSAAVGFSAWIIGSLTSWALGLSQIDRMLQVIATDHIHDMIINARRAQAVILADSAVLPTREAYP